MSKIKVWTLLMFFIVVFSSLVLASDVIQDAENFKKSSMEYKKYIDEAEDAVKSFQSYDKYLNDASLLNLRKDAEELAKDILIPKTDKKNVCQKTEDFKDKFLYFYSFSMPEQSIKQAIKDAVEINKQAGCIKVVLVVRGMKDDSMKESLKFVYEAMRDEKINEDLPMEMNPELFEQYGIKTVPTVVYDSSDRKLGFISGDRPLRMLIGKLEEKLDDYGKEGNTYPVKERDLREVFKERLKVAVEQFKERIPEIKKNMYKVTRYRGVYPPATEDNSFKVDMSITTQEDLVALNNRIIPKGTTFNPAKFFQLPGEIIVIDGENKKQLEFAMQKNYYKIIITNGDLEEIMKKYEKRVYAANDILLSRLSIKRTPSIIKQEGDYLVVTEKKID